MNANSNIKIKISAVKASSTSNPNSDLNESAQSPSISCIVERGGSPCPSISGNTERGGSPCLSISGITERGGSPCPSISGITERGGSPCPSISGSSTSLKSKKEKRKERKKEYLEEEILKAESNAWAYYMMEHYFIKDKMKELKELEQQKEKQEKIYNERTKQMNVVLSLAQRHNKELQMSQMLKDVPSCVPSEQFDKFNIIKEETQKMIFSLKLKNFNKITASDEEKIMHILKDTEHAMSKAKELIERKEMNLGNDLSELLESFEQLKNTVQKCESLEDELNNLLAKCVSLKIGLQSN